MNAKILCDWLGLTTWPPDHHALLGLQPGESDSARIEQRVHERMAKLRCYQLSHPEEATEGMNRLAQAFITLTEALSRPVQKQAAAAPPLNGTPASGSPPAPAPKPKMSAETQKMIPVGKTQVDWLNTPPPVRAGKDSVALPSIPAPAPATSVAVPAADAATAELLAAAPAAPAAEVVHDKSTVAPPPAAAHVTVPVAAPSVPPVDPILELARDSTEARRGLGTLPLLIERINLTRRLLIAWNQAGKYLSDPGKKLLRTTEEADLARRLNAVFELTAEYPKFVGQPGQPGYRVVTMTRLELTAAMFKMLDKTQRDLLAKDWQAGQKVLLAHRRFLRQEFKTLRRRGPIQLLVQGIRGAINDHPVRVAVAVTLVLGLSALVYWKWF